MISYTFPDGGFNAEAYEPMARTKAKSKPHRSEADDLERARAALSVIPSGLPRDDWHKVGRAAIAAGLSIEDLVQWSATASNYTGERDVRSSFKTITREGGTGAGTLFAMAREYGLTPSGVRRSAYSRVRPTSPVASKAKQQEAKPVAGMSAAEVWDRCEPATHAHAYIVVKKAQGVPLEHLRVVPAGDSMTVAGQRMAGALVVPAYNGKGELQSLQLIPPPGAGKKVNLAGSPMAGARHIVGDLEPGGVAYICEGIGAAWSCWQATGRAAVVAFGSGNMGRIAADLREHDAGAKLVLVPDTGKEQDAERIAKEVGAMIVTMPEGWHQNSDVNDLARDNGLDALAYLLEMTPVKPADDGPDHPLAQFVKLRKVPQAVKWVVPGVIEHGVVTIAGARGVGKTTSLLPLALSVAGLHEPGYPLAPLPNRWRHVVYAVEQVEQAERILAGLVECSGMGITWEQVEERLHLVEAIRLNVDIVVQVACTYREQFTRVVDGVEVLPLVVFDTQAASFEMDNENDNAEASRIMAALKQRFERLPVWIVGHVSKAVIERTEVQGLTARGAGAFEADSIANFYLTTENDQRYLSIGKRRAEPRFGSELLIESGDQVVTGFNEWGEPEEVHLRWGIVRPMEKTRQEARKQAQEEAERERRGDMREAIMNAVQVAWQAGNPLSKTGVKITVRHFKKSDIWDELESLLAEGWLHEVEVPRQQRIGSKARFLAQLDTPEHDDFIRSGIVPAAKLVIPDSWKKPSKPPVPEVEAENAESDGQKAD